MTKLELIELLRSRIADTSYSGVPNNEELVSYIDQGILSFSIAAIRRGNSPELFMKWDEPADGTLPPDFYIFAGQYNAVISGDSVTFIDGVPDEVYYFRLYPMASDVEDLEEIEIPRRDLLPILSLAAAFALNRNDYNIRQDLSLASYSGYPEKTPTPSQAPQGKPTVYNGDEDGTEGY